MRRKIRRRVQKAWQLTMSVERSQASLDQGEHAICWIADALEDQKVSDFGLLAKQLRNPSITETVEDLQRAPHRNIARHRIERVRIRAHHVAVENVWKNVHFHVFHARRYSAVGVQQLGRRSVVMIAPNDADGFA